MRAIRERVETNGGLTVMLPTEDSLFVCEELQRRFALPFWQLTVSATDANRDLLRICRQVQRRPYVLVFSYCYHGTVDEAQIIIDAAGRPALVVGNPDGPVDPTVTSKVVEFNDLDALDEALRPRDVACLLMEPALTNIGIVLPEPGYLDEVRRLCDESDTLLVMDETHTWCAGPS